MLCHTRGTVVDTRQEAISDFNMKTFLPELPAALGGLTMMQRAVGYCLAPDLYGLDWQVYKDGAYTYGDGASSLASRFRKREEVEHPIDDREPIGLRIVEWRDEREGKLLE
jgi:hypothetical protein